jgi:mycoredoxin
MALDQITMYGTSWCPDCARAKRVMSKHGVKYAWVNIEEDATGRAYVVRVNCGYRSVPTIVFPDGSVLSEPSDAELEKKLQSIDTSH